MYPLTSSKACSITSSALLFHQQLKNITLPTRGRRSHCSTFSNRIIGWSSALLARQGCPEAYASAHLSHWYESKRQPCTAMLLSPGLPRVPVLPPIERSCCWCGTPASGTVQRTSA
eukprot:scaffold152511_cov19-Tisochrysis_lutea.AAC.4